MRSDPSHFDLIAPTSLDVVLQILADSPERYTPIAGGTELMVALGAGRLPPGKFVSLSQLRELRFIDDSSDAIIIGSGATFTDLRRHPRIAAELPLLAQAASWTGSLANQNRGTLGGNIVNASPAADSPPALLVYDAHVTLISTEGERTLPYRDFHLGYKRTALRPSELLHSITLLRNYESYKHYIRKVGTRNAQAISKVALAALARTEDNIITDIRIAAASLRDTPSRLTTVEQTLLHQPLTPETITRAREAIATESRPIDDIRSTARYRSAVAANLLTEFLESL